VEHFEEMLSTSIIIYVESDWLHYVFMMEINITRITLWWTRKLFCTRL